MTTRAKKDAEILVRLTRDQKEAIAKKASDYGISSTELIVSSALYISPPKTKFDIRIKESIQQLTLQTYQLSVYSDDLPEGEAKNKLLNVVKNLSEELRSLLARLY